jgi:hypothetical protein
VSNKRFNLSHNLGLITGASVMGAVFAVASATTDITTVPPAAIATDMRITFAAAAMLIVGALTIAAASHALSRRAVPPDHEQEDSPAFHTFCAIGACAIDLLA